MQQTRPKKMYLEAVLFILSLFAPSSWAWGNSNNNADSDTSAFGNAFNRDWLYDSSSVSLKLEGCMWGFVGGDNEDSGCLEDSSEDGTSYWYQMANCRRAQAVFSLYAASGTPSCNNGNFKETFVTIGGLSEFIYYLQSYDANNPFGDYVYGDDEENDDGDNNDGNYGDGDDLPQCEEADGYYVGLGCASDGTFSLQYFEDAYCLQPSGTTYDKLKQLNRKLKTYRSCSGIYYGGNNGDGDDHDGDSTLPQYLVANSDPCSSLDSSLCTDNTAMKQRRSHSGSSLRHRSGLSGNKTWMTKLKYVTGGLLLLASFVMFTGILFTNRRRRRALMQRKYRQSKGKDDRKSKSSRSKSKSRTREKSRDGKSRRSRSRAKDDAPNAEEDEKAGVLT